MLTEPSFWAAMAFVVLFGVLGGRLVKQARAFLKERQDQITVELKMIETLYEDALSGLEEAQKNVRHTQQLTQQWLEDVRKHAQEVEQTAQVLMRYRRELACQNLELHLQDMRIRLHQELSQDFLGQVAQRLQKRFELGEGLSFLDGLHKAIH